MLSHHHAVSRVHTTYSSSKQESRQIIYKTGNHTKSVWASELNHGRHMRSLECYFNRSFSALHFTTSRFFFRTECGLSIRDVNEDTAQSTVRCFNGMKAGISVVPRGGRNRCASLVRLQGKSYDSYIEHLHLTSSWLPSLEKRTLILISPF